MQFRIHFSIGDDVDSFEVSGKTVENIQSSVTTELVRRGLDVKRNNCWSQCIETEEDE